LRIEISRILKNRYKILFEQDNILRERLEYLLNLLKSHVFANKLVDIKRTIEKAELELKTFEDTVVLPTIPKIEKLIAQVRNTIEKTEDQSPQEQFLILRERKIKIISDIHDKTIPIKRIFKENSFEEDSETTLKRYYNKIGKSIPSKNTLIGEQSLYSFLESNASRLNDVLFNTGISKFKQELYDYKCVEDADLQSYVNNDPKEVKKIAERSANAMVKINKDKKRIFSDSMYIPRMIIGENGSIIKDVLTSFKAGNYHHFKNDADGMFIKPELRNMLIFYCEHGYMSDSRTFDPLLDIKYIDEVEQMCSEYANITGHTKEQWHKKRNPYIKWEPKAISKIKNNINPKSQKDE